MTTHLGLDPFVLLRLTPVVASSCSLWYCVDQYSILSSFVAPANRARGNEFLPGFWRSYLPPGLRCIFGLYGLSIATAAANAYTGASATRWYSIGAALSLAHFAFVPLAAARLDAIMKGGPEDENWKVQESWLRMHAVRSVLVDFPAWACYIVAAATSVRLVV